MGAERHTTRIGGVALTVLANAEATLASTSGGAEVKLARGQIELDISDEARPVVVHAASFAITSTRAAFSATIDDGRLRLQVTRGELVLQVSETLQEKIAAPANREYLLTGAAPPAAPRLAPGPATPRAAAGRPEATTAGAAPVTSARPLDEPDDATAIERTYQQAEGAIASGDVAEGARLLRAMVQQAPRDRRADAARYDLARLADRSGDAATAKRWLGEVLASGRDEIVREPAHLMMCRVLVREKSPGATECLRQFRLEFPRSAHDGEMLSQLATLTMEGAGCAAALPLADEYLQSYPTGGYAAGLRALRRTCGEVAP